MKRQLRDAPSEEMDSAVDPAPGDERPPPLADRRLGAPFRVEDLAGSKGRLTARRVTALGWFLVAAAIAILAMLCGAVLRRSLGLAGAAGGGLMAWLLTALTGRLVESPPIQLHHEPGHRIDTASSIRRHRVSFVQSVGASGRVESTATIVRVAAAASPSVRGTVSTGLLRPGPSRADHLVAIGDRYERVKDFERVDVAASGPFAHFVRRWSRDLPVPIVTRHESAEAARAQMDWELVDEPGSDLGSYR